MEKNKKNRANSSINEFKLNIKNPFLEDAVEQINSKIVKKYKTATKTGEKAILKAIDENTGEILGHTQFIRQIEVDEEQFTKIYLSNFSAFFDLKPQ
ncbi:RepA protein, partial [Tenacibaculum dicentrarchi]|nr:RepA protein [Tenacibaculum dicentrarchi]